MAPHSTTLRLGGAVGAAAARSTIVLVGAPAVAAAAAHPTVVELFQRQGCSSYPPANANPLAVAEV